MNNTPKNEAELTNEIHKAMNITGNSTVELDDEIIAMVAEGRISELPSDQRDKILRILASDPQAGEMLAELAQLGLDSEADVCMATSDNVAHQSEQASQKNRVYKFSQITKSLFGAWAIAACLIAGLTLWQTPQSPMASGSQTGNTGQNVGVYSGGQDNNSYWDQLDKKRLAEQRQDAPLTHSELRDYALIGSVATCILLTAALILSLCHDHAKRRRPVR